MEIVPGTLKHRDKEEMRRAQDEKSLTTTKNVGSQKTARLININPINVRCFPPIHHNTGWVVPEGNNYYEK
jgi:hypothetical protein